MKRVINAACFAFIGGVMGHLGAGFSSWELWAVLSAAATASICSELMQ
jgi:uncharacterized membrane protein YvlD (DUF360 family)